MDIIKINHYFFFKEEQILFPEDYIANQFLYRTALM